MSGTKMKNAERISLKYPIDVCGLGVHRRNKEALAALWQDTIGCVLPAAFFLIRPYGGFHPVMGVPLVIIHFRWGFSKG